MTIPPRFTRTVDLYGHEGMGRIRAAGVVVAGLGGVGAHAAVALARSGVGRLHLIDFDTVTTSSLNRHPAAGPDDVGRGKAEVLAAFFTRTCPDTSVTVADVRVTPDNVAYLLPDREADTFGVIVDAIDSVPDKIALLVHAVRQGRLAVCSAGAGGKIAPGLLRSGTLEQSRVCPLARRVRRGVRQAGVDPAEIPTMWSEEEPRPPVADESDAVRRQPSNMMLPGMVGYGLAALAIAAIVCG